MKKTDNAGSESEIATETQQNIADTVNRWITEQREKSLAEKSLSKEKILAWKDNSTS